MVTQRSRLSASPVRFIALFLCFASIVVAIGLASFRIERNNIVEGEEELLGVVANLKVDQLQSWRNEVLLRAKGIAENPFVLRTAHRWLSVQSSDDLKDLFLDWMRSAKEGGGYEGVLLLDAKGELRLGLSDVTEMPSAAERLLAEGAARNRGVALSDVDILDEGRRVRISIAIPLFEQRKPQGPLLGFLLLRCDPRRSIFSQLALWPTAARTAQALLVRPSEERMIVLSEPRDLTAGAAQGEEALALDGSPASSWRASPTSVLSFRDYRGVRVFAAQRTVEGTPWAVVVKIDEREVKASVRAAALRGAIFVSLLLAASGIGAFFWWRKRYLESLAATQQQYLTLAESFEDFIFIIGPDDTLQYVNRYGAAALGRTPEEIVGRKRGDFFGSADAVRQGEALRCIFRGGASARFEQTTRFPDGELYLDTKLIPIRDARGNVTAVLGVSRDNTERERMLDALRASEENYRAIFDAANDAIFIHDCDTGAIVDVNEKMCELFQCSAEDARSLTVGEISTGEVPFTQEEALRRIHAAVDQGPQIFEWHCRDRRGRSFWGEVNLKHSVIGGRDRVLAIVRDVTERKEAEERIRESEAEFRSIFDNAIDGILLADAETKRFYLGNAAISRMLGYTPEEIVQLGIGDIHPPDKLPQVLEMFGRLRRGEEMIVKDVPLRRRDGSVLSADISASPVTIKGRAYLVGVFRDTTERRKAEEALKLTQFAVDHASDAIFWVGADARYRYVNDAACRNLGYSREELLAMTVQDIDPDMPAERWPGHWEEFKRRTSLTFESHQRAKGGRTFPVEVTINYLSFGGEEYGFAFVRDITARKEADEAIRRQQEFLRQVIDINPHFVFAKDREGKFTLANEAVARAYGTTADALIGKSDADFNPSAAEVDWFRSDDLEVMRTGAEKIIPEEVITTAAGERRLLRTIKRPIGPDQVLGVSVDITELKQIQMQLENYSRNLERMVAERTRELDRARADLFASSKLTAMGRMGAGIAHQLNSPLCGALLTIDALLEECREQNAPCEKVESLRRTIEGMRNVIECMLSLAMVSRRGAPSTVVIDLNEMVRRVVDFSDFTCRRNNVRIEASYAPDLPSIAGTVGELDQVVLNLIENAVDAMESGGTVAVQTERGDGEIALRVRDAGRGIPPEFLERVFEPFFSSGKQRRSLGLGLSIAREIVEKYGGRMTVTSEVGKGTEFVIHLPLTVL